MLGLRRVKWIFLFMAFVFFPGYAVAQGLSKYFGYYYNDVDSSPARTARSFDENFGHINLYHIDSYMISNDTVDREATIEYMLSELAKAKARGIHAIITGSPFVLHWNNSAQTWSAEPNAVSEWKHAVDELVDKGYIIPGNPQLSTVAAIYAIDEPNLGGFDDVNGKASQALVNVVDALRSDARVSSIPLAAIMATGFKKDIPEGLKLFDWVGFDDYGASQSDWEDEYNLLKSLMTSNQKTIIASKASYGGDIGSEITWDDPNWISGIFENDSRAAWLTPFVWFSSTTRTGARDIPALRSAYTKIGSGIKSSGCQSSAAERAYCLGSSRRGLIGSVITNLLLN